MNLSTAKSTFEVITTGGLVHVRIGKLNVQAETWCRLRDFSKWDFFTEISPDGFGTRRAIIGPFELFMHWDR